MDDDFEVSGCDFIEAAMEMFENWVESKFSPTRYTLEWDTSGQAGHYWTTFWLMDGNYNDASIIRGQFTESWDGDTADVGTAEELFALMKNRFRPTVAGYILRSPKAFATLKTEITKLLGDTAEITELSGNELTVKVNGKNQWVEIDDDDDVKDAQTAIKALLHEFSKKK